VRGILQEHVQFKCHRKILVLDLVVESLPDGTSMAGRRDESFFVFLLQ
jgi:hypothetical protein